MKNTKKCMCGKGNQHSIRESAMCDAMKKGKLKEYMALHSKKRG